jgi:thioesterase domain-containing protein
MARRLEAVGETVAMLASIDSIGPFWRPRRMANGVTYDPMMNLARVNAIEAGLDTGDVFSERSAADQFLKWLDEPVAEHDGVEVSRYIHTAYLSHPDLYATFSLGEDGDGRADHLAVVRWAQLNGTSQLEMQASFLPPLPPGPRPIPLADVRLRTRRRHAADRALDWLHFVSRGRRDSLAARRRDEVLRIAYENVVRYRAGPLTATVELILSEDESVGLQKAQLARWYGLEVGAIEEHFVAGSHHSMLREPAVRSLAACLERCATAGLEAVRTNAGRVE